MLVGVQLVVFWVLARILGELSHRGKTAGHTLPESTAPAGVVGGA